MWVRIRLVLAIIGAVALSACVADTQRVSSGVRVSTLGFGAEQTVRVHQRVALRGSVSGAEVNLTETVDGVAYDGSITLGGIGGQADFYPTRSGLYVTAGAFSNRNKAELTAAPEPTETITIGDTVYTGAEIGVVNADARFASIAPYVGAGWSGALHSRLELFVEAGAYFQGDPSVNYTATGPVVAMDPTVAADLAAEAASLEEDLSIAGTYPVASIGLRLRF